MSNLDNIFVCLICYDQVFIETYPEVFRPCLCEGYVHKSCLEKKLSENPSENCDLCLKPYVFTLMENKKLVISVDIPKTFEETCYRHGC